MNGRKGYQKKKTFLRDWSFLLLIALFGGIYTAVCGFPVPGGSVQAMPEEIESTVDRESDTGSAGKDLQEADEAGQEKETEQGLAGAGSNSAENEADGAESGAAVAPGSLGTSDGDEGQGPVYQTVEDAFFSDAVFIGDSRTVGLYEYGGLEEISTFCCSTGLTIYKMFDDPIVKVPGQKKKLTVEEVLSQRQFSAIYLMLGINEMGVGTVESFTEAYQKRVEHLRELQPDAVIYLQGIIKVTNERSKQGDYITNEGIEARNEEIAKLADNRSIFYLDVNPLLCDETGCLIESYTHDGVHLRAQYIPIWKDYLKSHVAVSPGE